MDELEKSGGPKTGHLSATTIADDGVTFPDVTLVIDTREKMLSLTKAIHHWDGLDKTVQNRVVARQGALATVAMALADVTYWQEIAMLPFAVVVVSVEVAAVAVVAVVVAVVNS